MRIPVLMSLLLLSDLSPASRGRFFVFVSANTGGAHVEFVRKLKRRGLTEVDRDDDCDYVLLFCPVASRVGTDVGEALRKAPAGKATVLVVMHHTFDPDYVVADSGRLVSDHPSVELSVDCLFYENHLLDCQRNDDNVSKVHAHLSASQAHSNAWIPDRRRRCSMRLFIGVSVIVVTLIVISLVIFVITEKLV